MTGTETDSNLAFLRGNIWGLLMKAEAENGMENFGKVECFVPDEDGNYLPDAYITRPSGRYRISVEKVEEEILEI